MNKYALFGALMCWLLLATYIVDMADSYLANDDFNVENRVLEVSGDGETELEQMKSLGSTLLSAIFFNVTGLPAIVSLICFTVPSFIFSFMAIDMLLTFLEAVIPF